MWFTFAQLIAPMVHEGRTKEQREQEERSRQEKQELEQAEKKEAEFMRFANALGYSETRNNWKKVNKIGCFGEFQFKQSTLKALGYGHITLKKFKKEPSVFPRETQLEALRLLTEKNGTLLTEYSDMIGDAIKGVVITKSGILAAAHLSGKGGVEKFLKTKGRVNKKDINGTSVATYMKKFQGYDL